VAVPLLAGLVALAATVHSATAQPAQDALPNVTPAAKPGLAVPPEGWAYLPELAVLGPADIYRIVQRQKGEGELVRFLFGIDNFHTRDFGIKTAINLIGEELSYSA
jgi:hypothetical protein